MSGDAELVTAPESRFVKNCAGNRPPPHRTEAVGCDHDLDAVRQFDAVVGLAPLQRCEQWNFVEVADDIAVDDFRLRPIDRQAKHADPLSGAHALAVVASGQGGRDGGGNAILARPAAGDDDKLFDPAARRLSIAGHRLEQQQFIIVERHPLGRLQHRSPRRPRWPGEVRGKLAFIGKRGGNRRRGHAALGGL